MKQLFPKHSVAGFAQRLVFSVWVASAGVPEPRRWRRRCNLSKFSAVQPSRPVLSVLVYLSGVGEEGEVWFSGQRCSRITSTAAGNAAGDTNCLVLRVQSEGAGCNRSDLAERIRSHWICSPLAVCHKLPKTTVEQTQSDQKCPRNARAGRRMVQFSPSRLRPSSAICPFCDSAQLRHLAALRPPFRRKTVSPSALLW